MKTSHQDWRYRIVLAVLFTAIAALIMSIAWSPLAGVR